MDPQDQDETRKQADDRPSIRFSDGGERSVDWIKYAAARRLGIVPREGESISEALKRWRAEEARRKISRSRLTTAPAQNPTTQPDDGAPAPLTSQRHTSAIDSTSARWYVQARVRASTSPVASHS